MDNSPQSACGPLEVLPSACPLDCPDACSLTVTVESGRVTAIDGDRRNPVTGGYICGKVRHFAERLYGPERVLRPAVRTGPKGSGEFREVSWDEALERITTTLGAIRGRWGGEAILPCNYGGSNGFLTQQAVDARFFHRLGASQLARTLCAAPSGAAAAGLYGKMPGVAYQDYPQAQLIVLWGVNPSATGIHLVAYLRRAIRRGARLIVVDPRRTPLARQADLHLAVRPGTDLPLALAVHRWLFENGRADAAFLAEHADGADELRRRADRWTLDAAARATGVSAAAIESLARGYADASPAVIRCGWGPERNRHGGSAIAAILALPAVGGKFGLRGGGYTMSNSAAWKLDAAQAAALPPPPTRTINLNQVGEALLNLSDPPLACLFVYNSNPLATLPRQDKMRRGLERDDLFTIVHEQVLTDTARYADVLLPATTFLEHHELHRGYGALILLQSRPAIEPLGEAWPNYRLFAELLRRFGLERADDPQTPAELTAAMLAAAPGGARIAAELAAGGAALPDCGDHPVQFVDVFPATANGRVQLVPEQLDRQCPGGLYHFAELLGEPDSYPLALISPASERSISSTFGELIDRAAAVEISPVDAEARGIADGECVRIFNGWGEVRCPARITPHVRPGVAVLAKGLWARHTRNGRTANVFAPDTLSDLGGGACFNDARVEIARAQ